MAVGKEGVYIFSTHSLKHSEVMKTIQCALILLIAILALGQHAGIGRPVAEFMTSLCMYYAPCFVLVKHSVCHEPISVSINV